MINDNKKGFNYYLSITLGIIGVCFSIYMVIYSTYVDKKIKKECLKFTIGYIVEVQYIRSKEYGYYYYYFNNQRYYDVSHNNKKEYFKFKVGQRYLVQFCAQDPDKNILYIEKQIPESIKEEPKNCWDKIPF